MTAMQSLQHFWEGFGLTAYNEFTVPDETSFPYLTYEATDDFFQNTLALNASLWYRSPSWAAITEKEQAIADFIGRGGRMIAFDGGAFWIKRGTPWAQRMDDPGDDMIRRIVLNVELEFIK